MCWLSGVPALVGRAAGPEVSGQPQWHRACEANVGYTRQCFKKPKTQNVALGIKAIHLCARNFYLRRHVHSQRKRAAFCLIVVLDHLLMCSNLIFQGV